MLPGIFHTYWLSEYITATFVTRADATKLKKDATTQTNPSNVPQRALAQGRDLDEKRGREERDLELSLYLQEQINYFKSKGDVDHLLAAHACQCSQSPQRMMFLVASLSISPESIWPYADIYIAPIPYFIPLCFLALL